LLIFLSRPEKLYANQPNQHSFNFPSSIRDFGPMNETKINNNPPSSFWFDPANELNQYTGRATAATVGVSGMAPEGATVTKNNEALAADEFLQRYFYRDIAKAPAAPGTAATGGLQSVGIAASGTSGGGWSFNNTVQFFVRPTTESFSYDDDGNLTSDGLWAYTYDAKNQLGPFLGDRLKMN
jgi:hypothetical protein